MASQLSSRPVRGMLCRWSALMRPGSPDAVWVPDHGLKCCIGNQVGVVTQQKCIFFCGLNSISPLQDVLIAEKITV